MEGPWTRTQTIFTVLAFLLGLPAVWLAIRQINDDAKPELVGCWIYNNQPLRMYEDGRVTGFLEGARWITESGENRYTITWPKLVDTVTLSANNNALTGSNNFAGPGISAKRVSGRTPGFVDAWHWFNGLTVIVSEGGTISAPAANLHGKWTERGDHSYRIEWNLAPVDQLVMSSDGRTVSGQNQFGAKVGGIRTSCS